MVFVETYGGMSASASVRLMSPSVSHPGMTVRPSPTIRALSSTTPSVRLIAGTGTPAVAAAAVSMASVAVPTVPTPKRKREDDDDYDLT